MYFLFYETGDFVGRIRDSSKFSHPEGVPVLCQFSKYTNTEKRQKEWWALWNFISNVGKGIYSFLCVESSKGTRRASLFTLICIYSIPLLSAVWVTHGQTWFKNIKWKSPQIKNLYLLNCVLIWIVWWIFALSCSVSPRMWNIFLSSISTLYVLPAYQSLSSHPGYQMNMVWQCLCSSNPVVAQHYITMPLSFTSLHLIM